MKVIGVHMDRCTGCKTCELYCGAERGSESRTLLRAVQETPVPQPRVRVEGGGERLLPLAVPPLSSGALPRRLPDRRAPPGSEERHGDHPGGSLHRLLDLHGLLSLWGDHPFAGEEDRDQVRPLPLHGKAGLRRCLSDKGARDGRTGRDRETSARKARHDGASGAVGVPEGRPPAAGSWENTSEPLIIRITGS